MQGAVAVLTPVALDLHALLRIIVSTNTAREMPIESPVHEITGTASAGTKLHGRPPCRPRTRSDRARGPRDGGAESLRASRRATRPGSARPTTRDAVAAEVNGSRGTLQRLAVDVREGRVERDVRIRASWLRERYARIVAADDGERLDSLEVELSDGRLALEAEIRQDALCGARGGHLAFDVRAEAALQQHRIGPSNVVREPRRSLGREVESCPLLALRTGGPGNRLADRQNAGGEAC